ncbi:10838_t:CDS:2 [Ambispora leptoticha]|uniref:10838_t:CDS:1 n=1 Tax=Ambispora leptoticha TaxID=144679 RepID=A0A9N9G2F1_9GLOM|nr:10838_t:CDS:2 [Ambispora leptoticha]
MTHNAKTIEELFTSAASLRISQKRRGDDRYKGDAGYWDGGRCEYGGAHNLQEDCQTLAKFFDDITELKNAKVKLTTFNNQAEFEKNKQNLLSKVNQALGGLQMKTDDFRRETEALKTDIEKVAYSEAKELQKLNQEERKLQKEIEENERKARNETDPDKKKKHINDFIQAIKDKLENKPPRQKKQIPGSNGTDPFGSSGSKAPNPLNPFQTDPNSNPNQNFFQNKHLIIITAELKNKLGEYTKELEKKPEPRELTEAERKRIENLAEERILKRAEFLIVAVIFYFNIYLPEQQRQQLEMQIQETINKTEGNPIQQEALENQKENLDKAIN